MKNYLSLIILTILAINLFAQNITVSFKTSDAGFVIDSVQAINLATNNTVSVHGNESLTLINLMSGTATMQNLKGSIFPNPCKGSATLQFSTSTDEETTIQIVNSLGQLVMEKKQAISTGAHNFSVGFPGSGIYIVLARIGNDVLSFKEVSNMVGIQEFSLSYLGSSQLSIEKATLKSTTTGKPLNYSTGNNIMYTLYSGKNIRVIVDQPTASKTYEVNFYECIDKDGNSYKTVTIGNQTWMAENLKTTKYNDGTDIPNVTDANSWAYLSTGAYCNYDNYESNAAIYGRLYNWETVNTGKLAPAGWHIPTDAEWTKLTTYLGGEAVAGGKLKEIQTAHWNKPNTNATDEFGFTAFPSGYRDFNGGFGYVGKRVGWWSSTAHDTYTRLAWGRFINFDESTVERSNGFKESGYSIRCVKD